MMKKKTKKQTVKYLKKHSTEADIKFISAVIKVFREDNELLKRLAK